MPSRGLASIGWRTGHAVRRLRDGLVGVHGRSHHRRADSGEHVPEPLRVHASLVLLVSKREEVRELLTPHARPVDLSMLIEVNLFVGEERRRSHRLWCESERRVKSVR